MTPLPIVGLQYRVTRYHTGDFLGRCLALTRTTALVEITDTLRPAPRVIDRCPFPQCVRESFHGGDHEFPRVRAGAEILIPLGLAVFEPIVDPIAESEAAA